MDKRKKTFLEAKKKIEGFLTKDHFMNTPYQHLNYWKMYTEIKKSSKNEKEN
jgi:hypothetical protein